MNKLNSFQPHLFVGVVLLLFISGCKKVEDYKNQYFNESTEILNVSFSQNSKVHIDSIINERIDPIYIQLESNKESSIVRIQKIEIFDSLIFILDNNRILRFTFEGNYIGEVGGIGRGPGEFNSIYDFFVFPQDNCIYVIDDTNNSISKFSISGELIESNRPEKAFLTARRINDRFYLYEGFRSIDNDYLISITDTNLVTIKESLLIEGYKKFYFSQRRPTYIFDDFYYVSPLFSRSIYSTNGTDFKLRYYFDFGEFNLDAKILDEIPSSGPLTKYDQTNGIVKGLDFFLEAKRWLYFRFSLDGDLYQTFYDKLSKRLFTTHLRFEGVGKYPMVGTPIGLYNNYIIGTLHPEIIYESSKFRELYVDNNENLNSLTIKQGDNPILILLPLK